MKETENELFIAAEEIKHVTFSISPGGVRIKVKGKGKFSWEEYFHCKDFIKAKKRYEFLKEIISGK